MQGQRRLLRPLAEYLLSVRLSRYFLSRSHITQLSFFLSANIATGRSKDIFRTVRTHQYRRSSSMIIDRHAHICKPARNVLIHTRQKPTYLLFQLRQPRTWRGLKGNPTRQTALPRHGPLTTWLPTTTAISVLASESFQEFT